MRRRSGAIDRAAALAHMTGASSAWRLASQRLRPGALRSVNYHHIPSHEVDAFVQQMEWISKNYTALSLNGMRAFVTGTVPDKPPIVLSFDDGLRSHIEVAAAVLEDLGMPGWFFVPTDAADLAPCDQFAWAVAHGLNPRRYGYGEHDVIFANWSSWGALDGEHVIGSHTASHRRFTADVDAETVHHELHSSAATLRKKIGRFDPVFGWVGGELTSYSSIAHHAICEPRHQLEFAFTTNSKLFRPSDSPFRIERTNVESSFSWQRFMLSLSGLVDLRYARKRRQLDAVFGSS